MSEQPQGPGWWQASDGRWYPPEQHPGPRQYPPTQQYPAQQQYGQQQYAQQPYGQPHQQPPKRSGNRGCLIAVLVVVVLLLAGGGVAAYFVYQAVNTVAQAAGGVAGGVTGGGVGTLGDARCPTQEQVGTAVGAPVTLEVQGSVVVAAGCSYLATDRETGADVQITTGLAIIAEDERKSFASDAATQDADVESVPVGENGQAYGGERRSAALTVVGSKLIEVEIMAADQPIGDRKAAAVALLRMVVDTQ